MSTIDSTGHSAAGKIIGLAKCGPGWQVRCLNCGFTQSGGRNGPRLRGAGRRYLFSRCGHCRRIRIHVIEKIPLTGLPD